MGDETRTVRGFARAGDPHAPVVEAVGPAGPGGVPTTYRVTCFRADRGPVRIEIPFPSGAGPGGGGGVTMEALIAVVIDRLTRFQDGPGACLENEKALIRLHEALHWLHARADRVAHDRSLAGDPPAG